MENRGFIKMRTYVNTRETEEGGLYQCKRSQINFFKSSD